MYVHVLWLAEPSVCCVHARRKSLCQPRRRGARQSHFICLPNCSRNGINIITTLSCIPVCVSQTMYNIIHNHTSVTTMYICSKALKQLKKVFENSTDKEFLPHLNRFCHRTQIICLTTSLYTRSRSGGLRVPCTCMLWGLSQALKHPTTALLELQIELLKPHTEKSKRDYVL